ncbi:MAG TPA: hypothetical protein PKW97_13345, partial [Syntrophorhabdus sp.]|nr:hypothetical protein [Syntrophorhabdus sp.]
EGVYASAAELQPGRLEGDGVVVLHGPSRGEGPSRIVPSLLALEVARIGIRLLGDPVINEAGVAEAWSKADEDKGQNNGCS